MLARDGRGCEEPTPRPSRRSMRTGSSQLRSEESSYTVEGRRVGAHVAIPASGHGPGVMVLHEAWGLDGWVRAVCARLAREGFAALAPDLFGGRLAQDVD